MRIHILEAYTHILFLWHHIYCIICHYDPWRWLRESFSIQFIRGCNDRNLCEPVATLYFTENEENYGNISGTVPLLFWICVSKLRVRDGMLIHSHQHIYTLCYCFPVNLTGNLSAHHTDPKQMTFQHITGPGQINNSGVRFPSIWPSLDIQSTTPLTSALFRPSKAY